MGYHIGLIPDGNRRWARENNVSEKKGHQQGAKILKKTIEYFLKKEEITELSVYVLSEENFKRSREELNWLNEVYLEGLEDLRQREFIRAEKVKINMVSTTPEKLNLSVKNIFEVIGNETKIYSNKVLNILIGYTGKHEILKAVGHPINRLKNLFFNLSEEDLKRGLQIKTPCDFVIRSSFEEAEREAKSGFLIWQSAYSEYYHINKNWGDVTIKDLQNAWDYFLHCKKKKGK